MAPKTWDDMQRKARDDLVYCDPVPSVDGCQGCHFDQDGMLCPETLTGEYMCTSPWLTRGSDRIIFFYRTGAPNINQHTREELRNERTDP